MDNVVIAGAGPTGIACAIALSQRGIPAVCCDRGSILDSIYRFPEEMRWFSTRDLLDIAGVPFSSTEAHPTRLETLAYYRGVAERFGVAVLPETEIERVEPLPRPGGAVRVHIRDRSGPRALRRPGGDAGDGVFPQSAPSGCAG